jgi:hypothetical protein
MIRNFKLALAGATMLASGAIAVMPAAAQTTTASARGQVRDASGTGVAGVTVTAVNAGTNQTLRAETDAAGNFTLNGLRPAQYTVSATSTDGRTARQEVVVSVGQALTLNLVLGAADAVATADDAATNGGAGDDIVVTANRLVETRTSEIATNVSQEQIRVLPQSDRNFLTFAALSPGVRYNDSETDKSFTSGASTASQVNVFIDGVSLKNKLREGGVAGQQNSRGNPFGQLAVQEFRVLTQNYKAEYEQAGAAIITAVTKSGTNEFHGEVFGQYTDRSLSSTSFINIRDGRRKPEFERKQYGVALGGPIIKDKLFFFATYEGNDQDRALDVNITASQTQVTAFEQQTGLRVADYEGSYVSPFRGDFYFGKLTLTPDENQVFDLSASRRTETDVQNFGGNRTIDYAENKRNQVDTYLFKWTYNGDSFVNEFNVNYLNYKFRPTAVNPDQPSFIYDPVIILGGYNGSRQETQASYSLRDDFTYTGVANHTIKVGGRVEVVDIEFNNQSFLQPQYTFRQDQAGTSANTADDTDFTFPAEARLGLGSGRISASNTLIGLYFQDDWNVTDKLQLNLGLRWDYETNGFNNEYRTPASAAAALRSLPKTYYFDPENYISDGTERKPFKGAFAPRFGFSYDLKGDQTTVIFGGAGRYYDRNTFSNSVDELSRTINPIGVFRFSRDGGIRNGSPTTIFNPSYLTREGLLALLASSTTEGLPELFAVPDNAKPPVNDQFSLGVRQKVGRFQLSVTGSYQRGRNGYTNLYATRKDNGLGDCCDVAGVRALGYSNVLIGYNGLDTRYKALYVTIDKNYSKSSGWGVNVAYTLSKAEQNGNDTFSLDGVTPDDYGYRTRPGDERHRVVLSGIADLPLGFQFSTLSTFGSGQAYQVTDASSGFGAGQLVYTSAYPKKACVSHIFSYCEVNLTLSNNIRLFNKHEISVAIDLLNAFNNNNPSGFDSFINRNNTPDPDLLDPANSRTASSSLSLPRRAQFRIGYRF